MSFITFWREVRFITFWREMSFTTFVASNGASATSNGACVTSNSIFDAKFDESRYTHRREIAQRSFFGPSGGKSNAAHPFLVLPSSIFALFVRRFSRRLRRYLAQLHQMIVEYAVVLSSDCSHSLGAGKMSASINHARCRQTSLTNACVSISIRLGRRLCILGRPAEYRAIGRPRTSRSVLSA